MPKLRRAGVDDAAALVRLRALMLAAMGEDVSGPDWRSPCEAAFRRRLGERDRFAAWVVESDGQVVSSGVGWIEEHLPSPRSPSGLRGHVASMSTDPEHRRQGHARSVLDALLGWFDERSVTRVELRATPAGRGLYERAGFGPVGAPVLSWTSPQVSPR